MCGYENSNKGGLNLEDFNPELCVTVTLCWKDAFSMVESKSQHRDTADTETQHSRATTKKSTVETGFAACCADVAMPFRQKCSFKFGYAA